MRFHGPARVLLSSISPHLVVLYHDLMSPQVYLAGPLFSEAERAWLDTVAARIRANGIDVFVPHEYVRSLHTDFDLKLAAIVLNFILRLLFLDSQIPIVAVCRHRGWRRGVHLQSGPQGHEFLRRSAGMDWFESLRLIFLIQLCDLVSVRYDRFVMLWKKKYSSTHRAFTDGSQVDDGTAAEIGIFSDWVRRGCFCMNSSS